MAPLGFHRGSMVGVAQPFENCRVGSGVERSWQTSGADLERFDREQGSLDACRLLEVAVHSAEDGLDKVLCCVQY